MRLNLGCGPHQAEGWWNVDVFAENRPEVAADGMHLPFRDATFSTAYVGHVLEYVHPQWVVPLMAEVRRAMRPGGRMVVVCPSLGKIMALCRVRKIDPEEFHRAVYGEDSHPWDRQLWCPDVASVVSVVKAAGFTEVEEVSRKLAPGWPRYEAHRWEMAVRASAPGTPGMSHDVEDEAETQEDPVSREVANEAYDKLAAEEGAVVRRFVQGGQYVVRVTRGEKTQEGRGASLDEAASNLKDVEDGPAVQPHPDLPSNPEAAETGTRAGNVVAPGESEGDTPTSTRTQRGQRSQS